MNRRIWTERENAILRKLYPHKPTKEIAKKLRRTLSQVYQHSRKIGLRKSAKYLASPDAYRFRRGYHKGWEYRFPKGNVPANKGLRRPGWAPGRMAVTQFKKGNKTHTWRPIGTLRFSKGGYLQRKVADIGYPPHDWKGVHILLWEEVNGPVPRGHAVVFKDGDKTHIVLENLECISRRELMLRNTVHKLPKEVALSVQLIGALNRQINKRSKPNEQRNQKQDVGPSQPSL